MKFLLDTNFLVDIFAFKIGLVSELSKFGRPELFALSSVFAELEKIRSRQRRFSRMAADFAGSECFLIESGQPVDTALLSMAKKGYVICTQDAALRKKISLLSLKSVAIRQKKYLEMI
ncbi:MAG: hypothetical protein HYX24_01500 [Candidatus Aenigmarchaeota archaeon]|nr:hypothetical protein [Candidatus Aenigmarchaeota archaeon]